MKLKCTDLISNSELVEKQMQGEDESQPLLQSSNGQSESPSIAGPMRKSPAVQENFTSFRVSQEKP